MLKQKLHIIEYVPLIVNISISKDTGWFGKISQHTLYIRISFTVPFYSISPIIC